MRGDAIGRRQAAQLPLGPDAIEARAADLEKRVEDHVRTVEDPDRESFLDVLRTRIDVAWLALEAAQAAMLQYGARGYLVGSEPARRSEDQ